MTYLSQPSLAEGFIRFKRRQRLKYGIAFAACATRSLLFFSIGASHLNGIDRHGDYRSGQERRAVLLRKLPSASLAFLCASPMGAIALRLKRLSEDSYDAREEQRIAHREWQK
jgi:hypothetical protein